ncbi:hypothetical protein C8Q75DRAFT_734511 [Abortiporus biennis]|nr:hypothetical protein C8Q75DRAFT_734511 [Abortiporus biennis]
MSAGASQDTSQPHHNTLPQYGFGADISFDTLVESNRFLFRVYTPKTHPPHYDGTEPYFLGSKYNDEISSATFHSALPSSPCSSKVGGRTYADVVQHMEWTNRSSSPFVSASFSFAWAIWEAIRRYHANVKHDVEIAVIDAHAVADRAVTAAELLVKGSPKERHKDHWKWYRFAVEAQDVLVWGYIPTSAVVASVPLLQILSRLPTYFLNPDTSDAKDTPLLGRLAWDYTKKKPSYRQFCQAMSDRFLRMPVEKRLRDTTAGSVRLAICLLRPFIHKHVSDDFTTATSHVCDLALAIACWPGQWWEREHPEIKDLIRCLVHIVGEEMREAKRVQALADATRMQEIVGGLEQLAQAYEARSRCMKGIMASPASADSTTIPPSPSDDVSESWSTTSTTTLSAMESKGIQTEPMEEKESKPSAPAVKVERMISHHTHHRHPPSKDKEFYEDETNEPSSTLESVARTASCFITCFFIGSFITLCVFSSHRRELANHLT